MATHIGNANSDKARSYVDVSVERDGAEIIIAFRDDAGRRSTASFNRAHASMLSAALVLATAGEDFSDTYSSRMRGELETKEARQ